MIEEAEAKRLNAIVLEALGWGVVCEPHKDEPGKPWRVIYPEIAEDYISEVGEYHYEREQAEDCLPDFVTWDTGVGEMQAWLVTRPGVTEFSIKHHVSTYYGVWGYIFSLRIDDEEMEEGHGKQEACLAMLIERVVKWREAHPFVASETKEVAEWEPGDPSHWEHLVEA